MDFFYELDLLKSKRPFYTGLHRKPENGRYVMVSKIDEDVVARITALVSSLWFVRGGVEICWYTYAGDTTKNMYYNEYSLFYIIDKITMTVVLRFQIQIIEIQQ